MPPDRLMDLRTVAYVLVLFVLMTILVRGAEAQTPLESAQGAVACSSCTAACPKSLIDLPQAHSPPRRLGSGKPFLDPPKLRPADVAWTKRVWRDIPLDGRRDSMAWHPGPAFARAFEACWGEPSVTVQGGQNGQSGNGGVCTERVPKPLERQGDHALFLRVREAWHFDRVHGVLRPYLEGMGIATGPAPDDLLSWADMDRLRPWLAAYPIDTATAAPFSAPFSAHCSAAMNTDASEADACMPQPPIRQPLPIRQSIRQSTRRPLPQERDPLGPATWYDVFTMRLHDGRIVQERNVFDRSISDYASGEAAFQEHLRIEAGLRAQEEAFWQEHDPMPIAEEPH